MSETEQLSADVVDAVSLERALKDAEASNLRVIALTKQLLDQEERITELRAEVVQLKRLLDPRRRAEHIVRSNQALFVAARRAKKMLGR